MSELVLYGIRLLAKQFLGTVLDIEVDHAASLLFLSSLGVEILAQPAGEGGREGVRSVRADLLDHLVVRLPGEIFQILLGVLHQPGQVGGQVPGCLELTGGYEGVRREVAGVVSPTVHHWYSPALQ